MFQSYALFPHMNVEQTSPFGLKQDGVPQGRDRRARRDHARARQARRIRQAQAAQLSGGQKQASRSRPLAGENGRTPLLDEPLGCARTRSFASTLNSS